MRHSALARFSAGSREQAIWIKPTRNFGSLTRLLYDRSFPNDRPRATFSVLHRVFPRIHSYAKRISRVPAWRRLQTCELRADHPVFSGAGTSERSYSPGGVQPKLARKADVCCFSVGAGESRETGTLPRYQPAA